MVFVILFGKEVHPFLASNFGDIAAAGMLAGGLTIASILSLTSFLFALPKKLRSKGRWHGWLSLVCAVAFFVSAVFLMTTLHRSLVWSDVWLFLLFGAPALVAGASLYFTRKKNA